MTISVDVTDLVNDFRVTGGVTIKRYAASTLNARGEQVKATPSTVVLTDVAVHTASGREMQRLPEADRRKEAIRGYTKVELFTTGDSHDPDVVLYDSKRYEVKLVDDYERQGGVYMSTAVLSEGT